MTKRLSTTSWRRLYGDILLINLVYLSYEKIYKDGNYAADNNKIISYYENNQINISLKDERQIICSNLKTPFGNVELYYKLVSLSVLATIISMITVFWALILKWRKKIGLSRKNAFIIIGDETMHPKTNPIQKTFVMILLKSNSSRFSFPL